MWNVKKYFYSFLSMTLSLFPIIASNNSSITLFQFEGDIKIYREAEPLKLEENLLLHKNDIICTEGGKALLYYKSSNCFGLFKGNSVRCDTPLELRFLNNQRINQLKEKKYYLEQIFSYGTYIPEYQFNSRKKNINIILSLDVSTSMLSFFDKTQDFIYDKIIRNTLIANDYIFFYTFGELLTTKFDETIEIPSDQDELSSLIYSLTPDEEATDIYLALEGLTQRLKQDLPYKKTVVFFITDGKHDPPDNSPYVGMDIYQENTLKAFTIIKDDNYKVMFLSIGNKSIAKDLSRSLGGDYIEVFSELTAQEINAIINNFIGDVEVISPSHIGKVKNKNMPIKLAFLSSYSTDKNVSITSVHYILDSGNKTKINQLEQVWAIKANQQIMKEIRIKLPKRIEKGKHLIELQFEADNINLTNFDQKIIFDYSPFSWNIVVIFLLIISFLLGLIVLRRRR